MSWGPIPFIPNPEALGKSIQQSTTVPGEFIAALVRGTAWVSDWRNWVRVAYVTVGGTIVIVGLAAVIFGHKQVASTATGYARQGATKAKSWANTSTAKPVKAASATGGTKVAKAKTVAKKAAKTAAKAAVVA